MYKRQLDENCCCHHISEQFLIFYKLESKSTFSWTHLYFVRVAQIRNFLTELVFSSIEEVVELDEFANLSLHYLDRLLIYFKSARITIILHLQLIHRLIDSFKLSIIWIVYVGHKVLCVKVTVHYTASCGNNLTQRPAFPWPLRCFVILVVAQH